VSDSQEVHDFIETRIGDLKLGFNPTEEEAATLFSDLGNDRFVDQSLDISAKERRASLTLKFLYATTRLHLDSLVPGDEVPGIGHYWEYQPTPHELNPLGNNFESLTHLVGNITRFEFDVHTTAGTIWQRPQLLSSIRCRLWFYDLPDGSVYRDRCKPSNVHTVNYTRFSKTYALNTFTT
jgi:hypothetical protein